MDSGFRRNDGFWTFDEFINGNVLKGSLNSKTATRLVREWIDLRLNELETDWELARAGIEIKKIAPLE
jgi:hypothetical protein